MPEKLKSRKLWVAIVAQSLLLIAQALGFELSLETIAGFVTVAVGYILGEAHADAAAAKSNNVPK